MIWTTRPRSEFGALRAIDAGEGPTVLLIHGVGLRAEAWNAQIDALVGRFRVVAIDMPGHGQSLLSEEIQSLSGYTDAIADGLDEPAFVIGHSMGAMIALDIAVRYPHLVGGVSALNAIFQRDQSALAAVQARAKILDRATVVDPSATLARWFGDTPSLEREACGAWLTGVDPVAYRKAYRIFAHENGPKPSALAKLGCPALFLTGRDEPNSTPEMTQAMADLAPHGSAQIIENASHMMPMTHAVDVNAALLTFFDEGQP
jgi:(E)-2-((N-methylformamido)methylene)succinate hydrolase